MDLVDQAEDRIEAELERAIAAARGVVPHGEGPKECKKCGELIEQARRELGYAICLDCAELLEHNAIGLRLTGIGL